MAAGPGRALPPRLPPCFPPGRPRRAAPPSPPHPPPPHPSRSPSPLSPRGGRAVSERSSLSPVPAVAAPDPAPGCGPALQIHHPGVAGPHQGGVPVPPGAVPQVSAGGTPRGRGRRPVPGRARGAALGGRVQAVACGVAAEPRRGTRHRRPLPASLVRGGREEHGGGAPGMKAALPGAGPPAGVLLPGQLRKGGDVEAGALRKKPGMC